MRIVICGTGCCATALVETIKCRSDISILCFSETRKTKQEYCGKPVVDHAELSEYEGVDYYVVAALAYDEIRRHLSMVVGLTGNIIHYSDFMEIIKNMKDNSPYDSVSTWDGFEFIYNRMDRIVGPYMRKTGRVYACDEIDWFIKASEHYYYQDNEGYFLDVGANIGSTSIYVQKKYPTISCLAIEPSLHNYRMLKSNCIINDAQDIMCVRVGASNINDLEQLEYFPENPGASAIVMGDDKTRSYADVGVMSKGHMKEQVRLMTLDRVLASNSIPFDRVKYLWIDTQGYEPKVLEGARGLLSDHPIPIFQEFNPEVYWRNNEWELFINTIREFFSYFLLYSECTGNNQVVHEIDELESLGERMKIDGIPFDNVFYLVNK